jgi:DUF1680 family protein
MIFPGCRAGLLDCYEVGGNKKALEIAKNMGAWVYARLKVLPMETRISMWNRHIAGEYGGMNEVLARLYRLTRGRRFLECARLFDNISLFFGNADRDHGLAKNVDTIRGKHANQHIPQITGALETFLCTRELPYFRIAENFWNIVTRSYMYSIGGVAGARNPNNAECFTAQPDTLWENGFAGGGQNETCATYNLLKLDRRLFMMTQAARYMDHYEQGFYNHILASVAEIDAGNTYYVPLNPGSQKRFDNAEMDGFTCCNGTALESNTKLQDSIFPLFRYNPPHPPGQRRIRHQNPGAALGNERFFRRDQRSGAIGRPRTRQLSDPPQKLAGQGHDRASDAVPFLSGSVDGPAQCCHHLLRSGSAGSRGVRSPNRLAHRDARCR